MLRATGLSENGFSRMVRKRVFEDVQTVAARDAVLRAVETVILVAHVRTVAPLVETARLVRDEEQPVDSLEERVLERDAPVEIHHTCKERDAGIHVKHGKRIQCVTGEFRTFGGEVHRRGEIVEQRTCAAQPHHKRIRVAGEDAGGCIDGRFQHVRGHAVPVVDVALDELPVGGHGSRRRNLLHVPLLDQVARDRKALLVRKDAAEQNHLAQFASAAPLAALPVHRETVAGARRGSLHAEHLRHAGRRTLAVNISHLVRAVPDTRDLRGPFARGVLAVRSAVEVVALAVAEEVAVAVRIELRHDERRADVGPARDNRKVASAGILPEIDVRQPALVLAQNRRTRRINLSRAAGTCAASAPSIIHLKAYVLGCAFEIAGVQPQDGILKFTWLAGLERRRRTGKRRRRG